MRYEDQPATTRAYLAGTFDVIESIVYEWRIRADGTSITQQRSTLADLVDRWTTKKMALASVIAHGDDEVTRIFVHRVLPGDLWVYFHSIPGCSSEWWDSLRDGIIDLWGVDGLRRSILTPAMRLCAWLVTHDRRDEAARLIEFIASRDGAPLPRTPDGTALELPEDVLVPGTVPGDVLSLGPPA